MDLVAALIRLKLLLTVRSFQRDPWRLVSAGIIAVIIVPVMTIEGLVFGFSILTLPAPSAQELIHLGIAALYVFWLALPLLALSASEAYDLTKLFSYPLQPVHLAAAAVFGGIPDPIVIVLLPTLCGPLAAIGVTPTQMLLAMAVLALFMIHTIAMGLIATTLLYTLLQSRRFKDFAGIVALLVGAGLCFLLQSAVTEMLTASVSNFLCYRLSRYIAFLPARVFSEALAAVYRGAWSEAFAWLAGCLALAILSFCGVAFVISRAYQFSGRSQSQRVAQRAAPGRVRSALLRTWRRLISTEYEALSQREWRYLIRDPVSKMRIIAVFVVLGVMLLLERQAVALGMPSMSSLPQIVVVSITAAALLTAQAQVTFNMFASDAPGIATTLLSPCSRHRIILAKSMFYGILMALVNLIAGLILATSMQSAVETTVVIAALILGSIVFTGCGNLMSVYLPQRIGWRAGRVQAPGGWSGGCARYIIYFALMAVVFIVMAPIILLLAAPQQAHRPMLYAVVVPTAVLYAAGVYYLSLGWAARALSKRQPEMVAALAATDAL